MKALIICLVAVFVLMPVLTVQAQDKADQRARAAQAEPIDTSRVNACSICFTCGGDYPIFSGALGDPNGLPGTFPATERGSGCADPLAFNPNEFEPFLCCK